MLLEGCVVDQNIEPPKLSKRLFDRCFAEAQVGDITGY